jgi:hypothetical protein
MLDLTPIAAPLLLGRIVIRGRGGELSLAVAWGWAVIYVSVALR